MKMLMLSLTLLVALSLRAQLPTASPKAAGFDPARLEVLHGTTKRFVEEGKHAGIITLLARRWRLDEPGSLGSLAAWLMEMASRSLDGMPLYQRDAAR